MPVTRAAERRALITGGAGFIGSHLADKLLARGWRVAAFDNLCVGRRENVAHLGADPRFALIPGDVADRRAVTRAMEDSGADTIFHLAALHYIPYCDAHPADAVRVNVLGTQTVAEAAAAGAVAKIVFASTSDVYAVKETPHREDDPLEPYTVYGTSKLCAERALAIAASVDRGLSVAVARFFNVYGPRETNPHVLPEIFSQLSAGDGQTVRLGNLWPKRDFVYVDDVTEALVRMAGTGTPFDVFNVGSGEARSIQDAVECVAGLVGRRIRVETDPARARPVERACLAGDIGKARRGLDWEPAWCLEDGLRAWWHAEWSPSRGAVAAR